MLSSRSHCSAASWAARQASAGRLSPNQTTPGRTGPPQAAQRGGSMRRPSSCSPFGAPDAAALAVAASAVRISAAVVPAAAASALAGSARLQGARQSQRGACRLPCRCSTFGLPARSCRSSTFCVITVSAGACAASLAMARCAAFGRARRACSRRHSYQPQTRSGWARKASGVARACASKRDHSPVSASRNVAMPLSAETPAPVKTTGRLLCRRACASGRGCRAASRSSRTGASGARGKVGGVMHVQPDRWFTTLPVRGHACQAAEQSPCLLQSPRAAHGHCACGVPNRGYWGQDFGNINGARADSPAAPDLGD